MNLRSSPLHCPWYVPYMYVRLYICTLPLKFIFRPLIGPDITWSVSRTLIGPVSHHHPPLPKEVFLIGPMDWSSVLFQIVPMWSLKNRRCSGLDTWIVPALCSGSSRIDPKKRGVPDSTGELSPLSVPDVPPLESYKQEVFGTGHVDLPPRSLTDCPAWSPKNGEIFWIGYTRRYGRLRGPTFSSRGGHWPSAEVFFLPFRQKNKLICFFFDKFNAVLVSSSNLSNLKKNRKSPKNIQKKFKKSKKIWKNLKNKKNKK